MVKRSVSAITDIYQNSILKDSSRNSFMIKRMEDLADRTIWAMGEQLKCGDFVPLYSSISLIWKSETETESSL